MPEEKLLKRCRTNTIFYMNMGDRPPNFIRPARGKSTWYKLRCKQSNAWGRVSPYITVYRRIYLCFNRMLLYKSWRSGQLFQAAQLTAPFHPLFRSRPDLRVARKQPDCRPLLRELRADSSLRLPTRWIGQAMDIQLKSIPAAALSSSRITVWHEVTKAVTLYCMVTVFN